MTFRTLKNLGLGLLLIILLLVVAYAQTRSHQAAATLEQVISRDIPAQRQLADVRVLILEAKLQLCCPTNEAATTPAAAPRPEAQLTALRGQLAESGAAADDLAAIDALLQDDDDGQASLATDRAELPRAIADLEAMAAAWPPAAQATLSGLADALVAPEPSAEPDGGRAFAKIDQATATLAQLRDALDRSAQLNAAAAITSALSAAQDFRDALGAATAAADGDDGPPRVSPTDIRLLASRLDEQLQQLDTRVGDLLREGQYAALDASDSGRRWFVWVAVVSVVLAGLISLLFSRVLSARIEAVVTATQRFSGGDLAWRLPVRGDDELGRLGSAFNTMAEGLRALVGNVHLAGIQVAGAATEIAATMKQQETSATEQAATASEIAASTREIASTSDALLSNVSQVSQVAQDVAGLGAESAAGLSRMETTMNQMADASRDIADKLAVLNEKAGTISSVVTTINKVADQTNLLSLNAAIEAEKAGEYGLGFGVVAKEIRRLADQTAVATWDIEQVVKEIQSAVSAGVMGMERFTEEVRHGVDEIATAGQQLSGIVGQVQTLAPHFESVHEGMQSQTQGAEQINQAIAQLSDTVSGAAEAMRDSERVVVQLNEAASRLQQAVGNFKLRE